MDSTNAVQNKVIALALQQLDQELQQIQQMTATQTQKGFVKLSESDSVTEIDGLALPTKEKNASISGTLANSIKSLQYLKTRVPNRGIGWDSTPGKTQVLFYRGSDKNWSGIGCDLNGSLHIRVGVDQAYDWVFSTDGHLYKNDVLVI